MSTISKIKVGGTTYDIAYPIGSIYLSVNETSPAELFGGTWEQLKDRFLLAAGDTYAAGSTGGESQHTLTQQEIPNYKIGDIPQAVPGDHEVWNNGGISGSNMGPVSPEKSGVRNNNAVLTSTSGTQYSYRVSTNGGSHPHNNMPPYLSVYMWKRIA